MRRFIDIIRESTEEPRKFDDEILYHGSHEVFERFERGKGRTAKHIYTSPDILTARQYGPHIYMCVGVQEPTADLIEDDRLIHHLATELSDRFMDHVENDRDVRGMMNTVRQERIEQGMDEFDAGFDLENEPKVIAIQTKKAIEYAVDYIKSGTVYEYDNRGHFQDELLDTCYDLGYSCVRFHDYSPHGDSLSVVFDDPDNLKILKIVS